MGGARALWMTIVLAGAASPAGADMLLLKDGRVIDGPKLARKEGAVVVSFENGDVTVKEELIHTVIIEGVADFVPKTDEEKEKFEQGLVPFRGKWMKPAQRKREIEKLLEEKRAEVEDARDHSQWGNRHQEETKNFRWDFTIPQHVWERYSDSLEAYYEIFSKDWRVKRDKRKDKLMINFFGDRKEFNRTSGAGGGALAYFMFLGDYDLCVFYDRLDPDTTEMVLFHEASHYMQKLVNEGFHYPHWPGEGLSEYYGGAHWDPESKKLDVGLIQEGRLTEVKSDISLGKFIELEEVVKVDAYTDYTWGWTLVHFLMETPKYKKGFQKYVTGLAGSKGVKRVVGGAFNLEEVSPEESLRYFRECLKLSTDKAVEDLQKEWYDYIQNTLQVSSTAGLEKAATAAYRDGKPIQAKRLFGEAYAAGGMSANGLHRYARMVRPQDKALAEKLWKEAIEQDPLVGTYYFELARLKEGQDEEEAKRLKALAKELDPEVDVWSFDFD